ncbi:hypothetical protein J6590_033307 [Homalodisca vitripennis]|nr:hypothetical protein J6590_033307 [Homalodisca vitripennis]
MIAVDVVTEQEVDVCFVCDIDGPQMWPLGRDCRRRPRAHLAARRVIWTRFAHYPPSSVHYVCRSYLIGALSAYRVAFPRHARPITAAAALTDLLRASERSVTLNLSRAGSWHRQKEAVLYNGHIVRLTHRPKAPQPYRDVIQLAIAFLICEFLNRHCRGLVAGFLHVPINVTST